MHAAARSAPIIDRTLSRCSGGTRRRWLVPSPAHRLDLARRAPRQWRRASRALRYRPQQGQETSSHRAFWPYVRRLAPRQRFSGVSDCRCLTVIERSYRRSVDERFINGATCLSERCLPHESGVDQLEELRMVAIAVPSTGLKLGAGVVGHEERVWYCLDDIGRPR
jgi:hypothetical protein